MKRVILAGVALATLAGGAYFMGTHHRVVDKDSCTYSIDADAQICDFQYEVKP